jgi:steroid delta-isomerase-like uncharacterized protein
MTYEAIVQQQTAAFNNHDEAAFASGYAPDAVVTDPQYPEPLRGKDAIGRDIADFFTAFPDCSAEIKRTVGNDGSYAMEVEMKGTHSGPLLGPTGLVPATGRSVRFPAGIFARLDGNGRIVEEHRYYDLAGQLAQLGLMQ